MPTHVLAGPPLISWKPCFHLLLYCSPPPPLTPEIKIQSSITNTRLSVWIQSCEEHCCSFNRWKCLAFPVSRCIRSRINSRLQINRIRSSRCYTFSINQIKPGLHVQQAESEPNTAQSVGYRQRSTAGHPVPMSMFSPGADG